MPTSEPISLQWLRATPPDVAAVAPRFDAYRGFYGQASDPPLARDFLFARLLGGECRVLLARVDAAPAGFVLLYPGFSSIQARVAWVLNDLYVAPAFRGRGLADALMAEAESAARAAGACQLVLETAHDNHAAQRLYERRGWRRDQDFRSYGLAL